MSSLGVSISKPSPFLEYLETGSREAMDRLVRQHIDFVYAAALRQVGDPHMAEDVTQAVFLVLARRVKTIKGEGALAGWLFKTVRYAAANAIKMAQRRRKHEQAAALARPEEIMAQIPEDGDVLLLSRLDAAIGSLGRADRDVILLRFLQGRKMEDVAVMMGVGEMAARKRVGRAVERLREIFVKWGTAVELAALSTALANLPGKTAPSGVVASVSAAVSGTASPAAVGIAHGVQSMFAVAQLKLIALIIVAGMFPIAGTTAILHMQSVVQVPATTQRSEIPDYSKIPPRFTSSDFKRDAVIMDQDNGKIGCKGGVYFIEASPGTVWVWNRPWGNLTSEFACEVVGRVASGSEGSWSLLLTNQGTPNQGIAVTLHGDGTLEIGPNQYAQSDIVETHVGPFANAVIKKGAEFNRLLVVLRGRELHVYVNGVSVCEPVRIKQQVLPGVVSLSGSAGADETTRAEFTSCSVWGGGN